MYTNLRLSAADQEIKAGSVSPSSYVVGIGASAGGLEALFFRYTGASTGASGIGRSCIC